MPGHSVTYIPEQIDEVGATSPPTARNNPFLLAWRDIYRAIFLIPRLQYLVRPIRTKRRSDELSLVYPNAWNLTGLVIVSFLQVFFLWSAISSVTFLPAILSTWVCLLIMGFVWLICLPFQGPEVIHAIPQDGTACRDVEERWFFVNGVVVTSFGFRRNCERLARTFGRCITGIHNPTYGLIGDILECIVQRAFSFNNYQVRFTYDQVKAALVDTKVKKVVLLCHSQGAIVASMVLDSLFADLAVEQIQKLEVYTFGSAASHFNNPIRSIQPFIPVQYNGVIPHIEHYVNGDDVVPRWGVLQYVRGNPETKYTGKIFIRVNASGHMLNQHYLSNMFPLPEDHPDGEEGQVLGFLDQVVNVDEETAEARRDFIRHGTMEDESGSLVSSPRTIASGCGTDIYAGKTVRDLSRLWRYMGGRNPDDEVE